MKFRTNLLMCFVAVLSLTMVSCEEHDKTESGGKKGAVAGGALLVSAGLCSDLRPANCNTCPAGTCTITVTNDTSTIPATVTLTLNGSPANVVCAAKGAQIKWDITTSSSSVLLDFGNASPFASNLTYYTATTGSATAVQTGSLDHCYKYNVRACPIPSTAGGGGTGALNCGELDPKVIIGNGG